MPTPEYSYSIDGGERFSGQFGSREEAIEEARCELEPDEGGVTIRTARNAYPVIESFAPDGDWIVEHIQEALMGEFMSENIESWSDGVSKKNTQALTQSVRHLVGRWISECGLEPGFFKATEVETYTFDSNDRAVIKNCRPCMHCDGAEDGTDGCSRCLEEDASVDP